MHHYGGLFCKKMHMCNKNNFCNGSKKMIKTPDGNFSGLRRLLPPVTFGSSRLIIIVERAVQNRSVSIKVERSPRHSRRHEKYKNLEAASLHT